MTTCSEVIKKLTDDLPELCSPTDLVNAGIVSHRNVMEYYRRKKMGPPYLQMSQKKIFYPKQGIIHWLQEMSHDDDQKKIKNSGKIAHFPGQSDLA